MNVLLLVILKSSNYLSCCCCLHQDQVIYRGIEDAEALEFFYVDPFTGRVSVKKSLYPGTRPQYTVKPLPV